MKGSEKNVWIVPLSLRRAALSTWDSKKKKGILKHSLHVQFMSEGKRINVLTWVVNGGLNESNTLVRRWQKLMLTAEIPLASMPS